MSETKALAIVPRTLDETADLAERFSKSTLLPKSMQGKAADVLVTIMAGAEMGLAPMASLRAIHVIEGKPVLSADGMIALVLGSGKAAYFERVEESDTAVTYETLRNGAKTPRRCTWTIQQAKAAGLHLKDNWRAYPRSMLASRAKSELARDVYPDVLAGCYTQDEIDRSSERPEYRAQATSEPEVIVDAEIVQPAHEERGAALADIANATSVEELKTTIAPKIAALKLTNGAKAEVNDAYKARLKALREADKAPAVEVAEPAA